EPHDSAELLVVGAHRHLARLGVLDPRDRELLAPGEAEGLAALTIPVLERQDPHHQEVRAVDPLVALGDHGSHAQEVRPLCRPVARRARAVLLAGEDDERHALGEISLRRLVDRRLLAVRKVHRPRPLRAGYEPVASPTLCAGAAHYY